MERDELIIKNVELLVGKSKGETIKVRRVVRSRGADGKETEMPAENLDYKMKLSGNKLTLPTHYVIPRGTKFHGQRGNIEHKITQRLKFVS